MELAVVCKLGTSCCLFGVVGNLHGNIEKKEYAVLSEESWLCELSLMGRVSKIITHHCQKRACSEKGETLSCPGSKTK